MCIKEKEIEMVKCGDRPYFVHTHTHTHTHVIIAEPFLRDSANNPPKLFGGLNHI